eukprot:827512-Pyramimonas_sp.AAC.1
MDVGRGAAGYDPSKPCPHYADDVLDGYYVHRDAISWMSQRDNQSRAWYVVYMSDYNYYCPRKGKDSRNKDKRNRPATHAGRGTGYRSRSPHWAS